METTYSSHPRVYDEHRSSLKSRANIWIVPVARFIFSLIFLLSGLNHFSSGSISYAANQGIPMADILVPLSGIISFIGGLSILLGAHARVGAFLILVFMVPVTFLMHDFWNVADPQLAQNEMTQFMKNLTIIGGALLLTFYGSGPVSIDHHRGRKAKKV